MVSRGREVRGGEWRVEKNSFKSRVHWKLVSCFRTWSWCWQEINLSKAFRYCHLDAFYIQTDGNFSRVFKGVPNPRQSVEALRRMGRTRGRTRSKCSLPTLVTEASSTSPHNSIQLTFQWDPPGRRQVEMLRRELAEGRKAKIFAGVVKRNKNYTVWCSSGDICARMCVYIYFSLFQFSINMYVSRLQKHITIELFNLY